MVGRGRPVSFCIGRRVLNLFCASGWQLYSTEVELFVLIESSYTVVLISLCSLAKRGIEVWSDVIFVIHLLLLEKVVSVCCEEESLTKSIRAFVKSTV